MSVLDITTDENILDINHSTARDISTSETIMDITKDQDILDIGNPQE